MRAKVTINIQYETPYCREDAENALRFAVEHLANNGLLSGSEGVVDEYSCAVEISENE